MNKWYRKIVLEQRIDLVDDAIAYFDNELIEARNDIKIAGNLEQEASRLPGIFEYRFSQQQEIDHILDYMNSELKRIRSFHYRRYLEKYNRELTPASIEKYIDGEDDVHTWKIEISKISLLSNQFSGLVKSLDIKHWQLSNVVKLRALGLEDISVE